MTDEAYKSSDFERKTSKSMLDEPSSPSSKFPDREGVAIKLEDVSSNYIMNRVPEGVAIKLEDVSSNYIMDRVPAFGCFKKQVVAMEFNKSVVFICEINESVIGACADEARKNGFVVTNLIYVPSGQKTFDALHSFCVEHGKCLSDKSFFFEIDMLLVEKFFLY